MAVTGIFPALVTPYNDDESLNLPQLARHVRRALDAGSHGVFCGGTNGEFYIQSHEERLAVVDTVVGEVNGAVPVVAGAGCIGTRDTVRMAKDMEAHGADMLSVIAPYFAAASQDELVRHFTAVAEAVSIPVMVYNIPARTGVNIAPATVARVAEVEGIVGVKDSSGNFDQILQYISVTEGMDFSVLAGTDSLILSNLLAGGSGAITAIANIYPRTMVEIYEKWASGDIEGAKKAQNSIRPIRNCLQLGNPNTVVKAATNAAGEPVGACRAPFNLLSASALEEIARTVASDHERGLA